MTDSALTGTVQAFEVKSHDEPEERRRPDKTEIDIVTVGGHTLGRTRFQPGWTWSACIRPVAKTESCQSNHLGYCTAGTIEVQTDDGKRMTITRGDSYAIPAGHNARVVGDEVYEAVEFLSAATYAKPS